jgi:hypothetical protein
MADSLGLPSNQWSAANSETSHVSSDFAPLPATHDAQDVSFSDRINKADSIRFSSKFTTLTTASFEPGELRTAEYVTKRKKVIDDGLGHLSDQARHWINATEDVQLEIIDAGLSEKFAKICDLNESVAAKVKELEAAEPVQGPNKELVAAHQEIEELEEELWIEKRRSAKLERRLAKCKSGPPTEQTDVAQLRLEKDMLLHQVKNISSEKTELESELRAFEHVIQRLTTNQVHATPAPNTFTEPAPGPSGSRGFSIKSSNLPTYDGKRTLDDITAFLFALERHFKNAAQAIGWVGTTGWGEQAVLQLTGDAATWAMHRFPISTPIEWSTI